MAGQSPQPRLLPALDLPVRVLRDEGRLELAAGEIVVGPHRPDDPRPRVVQWRVDGGLMPDEMILIFGRPLDWTGPVCDEEPSLPLVEDCLGGPFILTRQKPLIRSPEPVIGAGGDARVGWCYGAVLLRGEDRPWYTQSILRLTRSGRIG
ncbi:hypothetical protein DRQ53_06295 [bacterium]|nr:MAG: hypothetical protein DRQ32_00635 [bacterium]RKZ16480.1 MAG: hypothetical protein DRQ53_06295 [bacterium]